MTEATNKREGSLDAPVRHPIAWQSKDYYDETSLMTELERVFDICHGCRRCFNLCNAFPTLFDAVDESESMELDTVPKEVFWDVVGHCYLCDMCYMTQCPYVPPHEWNVDFPHLMLRAKAQRFRKKGARTRDRILTSTDAIGKLAGIPVVVQAVNAANRSKLGRAALQKTLGAHAAAPVPPFHSKTARKRLDALRFEKGKRAAPGTGTQGKVVLFTTCYGNYDMSSLAEDLVAVFEHNDIPVALAAKRVMLRHAETGTGRSRSCARGAGCQHSRPGVLGRHGLGHRDADSFLHIDVQTGTAADVSRRRRCRESSRRHVRSVRIPDAQAPGRSS